MALVHRNFVRNVYIFHKVQHIYKLIYKYDHGTAISNPI